jgi:hypothetical protein
MLDELSRVTEALRTLRRPVVDRAESPGEPL